MAKFQKTFFYDLCWISLALDWRTRFQWPSTNPKIYTLTSLRRSNESPSGKKSKSHYVWQLCLFFPSPSIAQISFLSPFPFLSALFHPKRLARQNWDIGKRKRERNVSTIDKTVPIVKKFTSSSFSFSSFSFPMPSYALSLFFPLFPFSCSCLSFQTFFDSFPFSPFQLSKSNSFLFLRHDYIGTSRHFFCLLQKCFLFCRKPFFCQKHTFSASFFFFCWDTPTKPRRAITGLDHFQLQEYF